VYFIAEAFENYCFPQTPNNTLRTF